MRALIFALALVLSGAAWGQPSPTTLSPRGDASNTTVMPLGGTAAQTAAFDESRVLDLEKGYGVKFDSADYTSNVQAALDYAHVMDPTGANGYVIQFPRFYFNVNSCLTVYRSQKLRGYGQSISTINYLGTTGLFCSTPPTNLEIENLQISAASTGANPLIVNGAGNRMTLRSVGIQDASHAIQNSGDLRIWDAEMNWGAFSTAPVGSIGIEMLGGRLKFNRLLFGVSGGTAQTVTPMSIKAATSVDGFGFQAGSLTRCLAIEPGSGQTVFDVRLEGLECEGGSGNALDLAPTGGTIRKVRVLAPHIYAYATGIASSGTGTVRALEIIGGEIHDNTSDGVSIGLASDYQHTGGLIWANGRDGIRIGAGLNAFQILGVKSGAALGFAGNTGYGINILAGASDRYIVKDNVLASNTAGPLFDGGTGGNKLVSPNVDEVTRNVSTYAPAATGSNPTYTASGPDTNVGEAHALKGTANLSVSGQGSSGLAISSFAPTVYANDLSGGAVASALRYDHPAWTLQWDQAADGTYSIVGMKFRYLASAVNYWSVSPAVTTNGPLFQPEGTDTNIAARIMGKGVGFTQLGSSTSPIVALGAVIDSSGVRVALGSTYTVPANTSLVRLTQASTVASSTITLPTALSDGHPIQFDNYQGQVTSLSFSPAVIGWTNGSTFAPNSGARIRWDAVDGNWHREQ